MACSLLALSYPCSEVARRADVGTFRPAARPLESPPSELSVSNSGIGLEAFGRNA